MSRTTAVRISALSATLVAALVLVSTAPALASERPIDITGYTVKDVVVKNGGCVNLSVKAKTKTQNDYLDSSGTIDVTRGGTLVDWMSLDDTEITDRAYLCPSLDGVGTYKVGPADITAYYMYWDSYYEEWDYDTRSYTDYTTTSFNVRGHAKANLSAKRSGGKVTLQASASWYKPSAYQYVAHNPKQAKFQVKSGSTWKTVRTVNFKNGKASVTVNDRKAKQYRVVLPQGNTVTSATSKTVKK